MDLTLGKMCFITTNSQDSTKALIMSNQRNMFIIVSICTITQMVKATHQVVFFHLFVADSIELSFLILAAGLMKITNITQKKSSNDDADLASFPSAYSCNRVPIRRELMQNRENQLRNIPYHYFSQFCWVFVAAFGATDLNLFLQKTVRISGLFALFGIDIVRSWCRNVLFFVVCETKKKDKKPEFNLSMTSPTTSPHTRQLLVSSFSTRKCED